MKIEYVDHDEVVVEEVEIPPRLAALLVEALPIAAVALRWAGHPGRNEADIEAVLTAMCGTRPSHTPAELLIYRAAERTVHFGRQHVA